ncbi:uncharacterized protein LOC126625858 [Malus sylvestris]|uniref:uncharacterized protein LOC126625858 n=1 Tax=Malus sylvestris TaxID=3752 RepID=UPI0021ABD38E|nr:uncharacterized protein LOC126625858 [Malus sylvestris]
MEYVSVPQPFSGTAVATVPHRSNGGLELAASSNQTPQDETYIPAWALKETISAMNQDQLIPVNRAKAYRKASTPQRGLARDTADGQCSAQSAFNKLTTLSLFISTCECVRMPHLNTYLSSGVPDHAKVTHILRFEVMNHHPIFDNLRNNELCSRIGFPSQWMIFSLPKTTPSSRLFSLR